MPFVWIDPPPLPPDAPVLHGDPLVNRILHGVVDSPEAAADFLDPSFLPAPDPSLLPNIDDAVARVASAARNGETIAVFGDYDADGVTSTAILLLALGSGFPLAGDHHAAGSVAIAADDMRHAFRYVFGAATALMTTAALCLIAMEERPLAGPSVTKHVEMAE